MGPAEGRRPVGADPGGGRAHAGLLERIQATRQLLVCGAAQEEYLAAIDILRRMAENLERPGA